MCEKRQSAQCAECGTTQGMSRKANLRDDDGERKEVYLCVHVCMRALGVWVRF